MSVFQPYLNKELPESVQVLKSHDVDWPTRVNILIGELDDNLTLDIVGYMILDATSQTSDSPVYTVHLPIHLASYAAASALYRLLAGVFISETKRPASVQLVAPQGEDPDMLSTAVGSLGVEFTPMTITFSQFIQLWFYASDLIPSLPFPYVSTITTTPRGPIEHPKRPVKNETGTLYSRYIPHLKEHFQLRYASDTYVDLLHEWMNDPRVDKFWQEGGPIEKQQKFLKSCQEDPSILPVIGSYVSDKETPATFFMIYWAKEDPIGEFYDADDYDRGIHMLVGSKDHRGPHRVAAWLPSLCHHIFSSEPRTRRIVSEPNHLNEKMVNYLKKFGFKQEKLFDFPHKRAALMVLDRQDFWKLCPF